MRKFKLFTLFFIMSVPLFGQDIIISFEGQGASTEVTTVEVENLSNSTSIEVPGGSSLNLTTGTVGIAEFENERINNIKSYPNPFVNSTNIEFYLSQNDFVIVTACDITGKIVAEYGQELKTGAHSFDFTANNSGLYFVNISGASFKESSKVICLSNTYQQAQLTYNEQVTKTMATKSYKSVNSKDFSFTPGDTLKLKGISGDYNYATVMVIKPTVSETYIFNFVVCQDADGNNYAVVEIGNQEWMAENLKTTTYNDGTPITLEVNSTYWSGLTTGAYCWYDNDQAPYAETYGALYNWYAVHTGNLCPAGWHVPTDAEWTTLTDYMASDGHSGTEGTTLKATSGWNSDGNGTNDYGFTALPGGYRSIYGTFFNVGYEGRWWSATAHYTDNAWLRRLLFNNSNVFRNYTSKGNGFSVRCLRD
jgi:uncharacterized protein (TIGR02145 family)